MAKTATCGLFVVPKGELESWLEVLGVTGHGPDWLNYMFQRLGAVDSDPTYVRPGRGDVWRFLDRVAKWTNDPSRLGMA